MEDVHILFFRYTLDLGLDSVGQGGSIMALNYLGAWEGRRYYRAEDTYVSIFHTFLLPREYSNLVKS